MDFLSDDQILDMYFNDYETFKHGKYGDGGKDVITFPLIKSQIFKFKEREKVNFYVFLTDLDICSILETFDSTILKMHGKSTDDENIEESFYKFLRYHEEISEKFLHDIIEEKKK